MPIILFRMDIKGLPLVQPSCCHGACNLKNISTIYFNFTPDLPLNLTTIITFTMLMMASLIGIIGYYDCSTGLLECDTKDFPGISHVMGLAPFNKLYSIMLTVYSCIKQAEARAHHHRLSAFTSPLIQTVLLSCALLSIVFGPCIGFFDVFYDSHTHGQVTKLFTIGEVAYIFLITGVLNGSRDHFTQEGDQGRIDTLVTCRFITVLIGLTQQLPNFGIQIGIVDTLCEWAAFYMCFYIHYVLSQIMRYEVKVVHQAD